MPKGHLKEVSKTSSSSIDSIRDQRDISSILSILDDYQIKTRPFGANISGENSYRRAERISAALHVMTNHISEEEPLRSIIRNKCIELLTIILELRSGLRTPASEKGQSALATIRELISLVRLLAVSGFLSVSNANALTEALDELGSLIVVSQRSTLAEQVTISREDFIPSSPASPRIEHSSSAQRRAQRAEAQDVPQEHPSQALHEPSSRSQRIMEILKLGGVLGIKDVSSNLPQYSEKMVQRELAGLVAEGKVRKIGAKRWSKYGLVQ